LRSWNGFQQPGRSGSCGQQAPPPQQVVYAAPPPEAPPAQEEDVITQLERLGALKAQGLLTEEEFAAQKAKLLGG